MANNMLRPENAYTGQTNVIDQYPGSGVNIPQVDAIRRARGQGGRTPLYGTPADVTGTPNRGAPQERTLSGAPDRGEQGGYQTMQAQMPQVPQSGDQLSPLMGRPTGRGKPQPVRRAPIVRPREAL